MVVAVGEEKGTDTHGPMAEYEARVESGRLRDDEHQRGRKPPG